MNQRIATRQLAVNVFWNETVFPLCSATDSCWNRKLDSLASPVMLAVCLPVSCTSSIAWWCLVPLSQLSMATIIIIILAYQHKAAGGETNYYYYYYYYKMYWLEWRCHRITVAGALNNEKEKMKSCLRSQSWMSNDNENSAVFSSRQNSCNDDAARIEDGKSCRRYMYALYWVPF